MGFLVPVAWAVLGVGVIAVLPSRFAKLKDALGLVVVGLPVVGVFGIVLWDEARLIWRSAH